MNNEQRTENEEQRTENREQRIESPGGAVFGRTVLPGKTVLSSKTGQKIMTVVLMAAVFMFFGCERIKGILGMETESEVEAPSIPVFAVNTIFAVQGPIQDYINFSGDIVAGSTVDVYPEMAGRVSELYVSVGSRVGRGARIAAIDPSRPGMTFMPSIATAPIGGTIVAIPAQIGMTVSQAVPLVRIAGGGGLEIRLHVAERFISRMAMNQACEITIDAWPGETFYGNVSELAPTVDVSSRTMEVRINIHDPGSRLKAGMFAKVRVIIQRKDNIVKIPSSAVISRFGEHYVYAVEKDEENLDIVKRKNIIPGIVIDGVIEIQSGLAADDEVVVRGQTLLDDGSRVNVIERVTPLRDQL